MSAFTARLRRSCLGIALVAISVVSATAPTSAAAMAPPASAAVTVDELLTGFANMPGLYAEFRQESYFGLLAEPLVDTGTIHFAGGKLARRTLSPTPSVVVMDG
jgi:outer membrane lipoprotein-sorting protein